MTARATAILDRSAFPYPDVVAVYEMTEQEYLDWDQPGGLADWVDGRVYHYMAAAEIHQVIVFFLSSLLSAFGSVTGAGRVLGGPYAMRTRPGRTWREPDLVFITPDDEEHTQAQGLFGPAGVVIEVISPGSPKRDLEDKFLEYAALGVREYWVIDPRPRRRRAIFYRLDTSTGAYEQMALGDDGAFHSSIIPGFWLRPEWLWEARPDALVRLGDVLGPEAIIRHLTANR